MENNVTYNYNKSIKPKTLATPSIGVIMLAYSFYDKIEIAIKNLVILPYPYSDYFLKVVGALMILSFIATFFLSRKKRFVILANKSLDFTKGSFSSKDVSWNYNDISSLQLEEDEDDGKYLTVVAFQGTTKGTFEEFYEENFDSRKEFESFYKSISDKIVETSE